MLLLVLVSVAILVGTLTPSDKLADFNIWSYDKIAHFLMFFIWTFLYGLVMGMWKQKAPNLFLVFLFGLSYGLLVEILQFLLPTNRSPEFLDFVADGLGSVAAVVLLAPVFKKWFADTN